MSDQLLSAIRSIRQSLGAEDRIKQACDRIREKEMSLIRQEVEASRAEGDALLEEARRIASGIVEDGRNQANLYFQQKKKELEKIEADLRADAEAKIIELEARKQEVETLYREAEGRGNSEGFEKGFEQGMQQFAETVSSLADVLREIDSRTEALVQSHVPNIIEFVRLYSEKILGVLPPHVLDCVLNNVTKAMQELSRSTQIKVVVSEKDYESLQAMYSEFQKRLPPTARVELLKDANMAPGGCMIETELGSVDATVETQTALLNAELFNE